MKAAERDSTFWRERFVVVFWSRRLCVIRERPVIEGMRHHNRSAESALGPLRVIGRLVDGGYFR
jgi:hypothetical protein